jgi:hypothetical protein
MMLPSGIPTLLKSALGTQPACSVINVHVSPLFSDRHTSFLNSPLMKPPIMTMLPSGITTLL